MHVGINDKGNYFTFGLLPQPPMNTVSEPFVVNDAGPGNVPATVDIIDIDNIN